MNKHWMENMAPPYNLKGHYNKPSIDADTIINLMQLKNDLLGTKRTILEESLIAEEKNEQVF